MSKIRQALQLLADSGLSMRQVAAALVAPLRSAAATA
jgi:hypothetical protein